MFGFKNAIKTVAGQITLRHVILAAILATYAAMAMGWISETAGEEFLRALNALLAL